MSFSQINIFTKGLVSNGGIKEQNDLFFYSISQYLNQNTYI